jgi:hypothetical protein
MDCSFTASIELILRTPYKRMEATQPDCARVYSSRATFFAQLNHGSLTTKLTRGLCARKPPPITTTWHVYDTENGNQRLRL